jgi:stage III sporulation protein AD
MYLIKLCCIVLITAVCAFILKNHKSELVPLCLLAGGVILFLYAFDYLTECVEFIKSFSETCGVDSEVIRIIFKVIGIGFIIEMTASSVKELGFESLSDKLILCGKVLIFIVAVPIVSSTYKIIMSLIDLI